MSRRSSRYSGRRLPRRAQARDHKVVTPSWGREIKHQGRDGSSRLFTIAAVSTSAWSTRVGPVSTDGRVFLECDLGGSSHVSQDTDSCSANGDTNQLVRSSMIACITGGHTPLPIIIIRSRRLPCSKRYVLGKPIARRSSSTWSILNIGSRPAQVTKPKRSSVVNVRNGRSRGCQARPIGTVVHDEKRVTFTESCNCSLGPF